MPISPRRMIIGVLITLAALAFAFAVIVGAFGNPRSSTNLSSPPAVFSDGGGFLFTDDVERVK